MGEYIKKETAIKILRGASVAKYPASFSFGLFAAADELQKIPAADVVEVETVAQMLYHALGDECPCNYGSSDEWLPEVCELQDECPNPKDKLGCWKQYIKHFGERWSE